jgi:hypothetical protein
MLRKNPKPKANLAKKGLAGAKAQLILLGLLARLKPCPCYKAAWQEFFRSLFTAAELQTNGKRTRRG